MSHFPVVVVTDSPDDVESVLAPFDENLDVAPHPETIGTVAEQAQHARSFYLGFPQYTPEALMKEHFWDVERWDLTGPSIDRPDLKVNVTPGDETAEPWSDAYKDQHRWNNRQDAKRWLDGIPDADVALAYAGDDYQGARIEGEDVVYDSTSNPDGHWDWWEVGGRWRGFFHRKPAVLQPGDRNPGTYTLPSRGLLDSDYATVGMRILTGSPQPGDAVLGRPGVGESMAMRDSRGPVESYAGRADQLQWRDVDFDAMREHERTQAETQYDAYETATAGIEAPTETFPQFADRVLTEAGLPTEWPAFYASVQEQHEAAPQGDTSWRKPWDDAMGTARQQWGSHPWVKALRAARIDPFEDPIDFYCVRTGGRDEYIRRAVAHAGVPYALVIKGEWIAKDRMGWFGMSSDTASQDEWNAAVQAFYAQLGDDVWVTAVDCHT